MKRDGFGRFVKASKPGRETYRNGAAIGMDWNGCDGCDPLTINGAFCHESGCPDAWKDSPVPCFECGFDFLRESDRHERTCPDCVRDAEERAEEWAKERAEEARKELEDDDDDDDKGAE